MKRAELEERKQRLLEYKTAQQDMKTVAGLFSNSLWNALPQKIKEYFEAYRKEQ